MSLRHAFKEDFDVPGLCPLLDDNLVDAYYVQNDQLVCCVYIEKVEMEYEEYVGRFHNVYENDEENRTCISWETNYNLGCVKSDSIESLIEQLLIAY